MQEQMDYVSSDIDQDFIDEDRKGIPTVNLNENKVEDLEYVPPSASQDQRFTHNQK